MNGRKGHNGMSGTERISECDLGYDQHDIPVGGRMVTSIALTDADGQVIASTTSTVERTAEATFTTSTEQQGDPEGDGGWD